MELEQFKQELASILAERTGNVTVAGTEIEPDYEALYELDFSPEEAAELVLSADEVEPHEEEAVVAPNPDEPVVVPQVLDTFDEQTIKQDGNGTTLQVSADDLMIDSQINTDVQQDAQEVVDANP